MRISRRPWSTATVAGLTLSTLVLAGCATAPTAPDRSPLAAADDDTFDDADEPGAGGGLSPETLPVVTYDVYLARDPFEPVREPEEPEPTDPVTVGPGAPTPADPAPGDPAPGTPGAPAPGDPTYPAPGQPAPGTPPPSGAPGAPSGPDCRDQGEVVCNGITISLDGIEQTPSGPVASLVVNGVTYQVRDGDVFADHFVVRSIERDSVWVSYGDELFELTDRSRRLK